MIDALLVLGMIRSPQIIWGRPMRRNTVMLVNGGDSAASARRRFTLSVVEMGSSVASAAPLAISPLITLFRYGAKVPTSSTTSRSSAVHATSGRDDVTWLRLDDQFCDHPKVAALSDRAFRMHVAALNYCARMLTDGRVQTKLVPRLVTGFRTATIRELLDSGLWMNTDDGYEIHDFLRYNPSRIKVSEEREANAARQQAWRDRQATNPVTNGASNTLRNGVTNGAPTRPVPSNNQSTTPTSTRMSSPADDKPPTLTPQEQANADRLTAAQARGHNR